MRTVFGTMLVAACLSLVGGCGAEKEPAGASAGSPAQVRLKRDEDSVQAEKPTTPEPKTPEVHVAAPDLPARIDPEPVSDEAPLASSDIAAQPVTESDPPVTPKPVAVVAADPVDALLDRLDVAAADLTGFTADLEYHVFDALMDQEEIRTGELIYELDQVNDAQRFAILFETMLIGSRLENRLKHFIFDGQWLTEIDHRQRRFIKNQIVPPGQKRNLLKLGEGPFPLPIGQSKEEVLARFQVSLHDLPEDGPLAGLDKDLDIDGLLLIPRPGMPEARDFARLELFYDRKTMLPVGIIAVEPNDNSKTVRLSKPVRNPVFDDVTRQKLHFDEPDPNDPDGAWQVDIQPWQGRSP